MGHDQVHSEECQGGHVLLSKRIAPLSHWIGRSLVFDKMTLLQNMRARRLWPKKA